MSEAAISAWPDTFTRGIFRDSQDDVLSTSEQGFYHLTPVIFLWNLLDLWIDLFKLLNNTRMIYSVSITYDFTVFWFNDCFLAEVNDYNL